VLQRSPAPTNADALAVLAVMGAPYFSPGDATVYSNTGFDLLAVIVERITGQPFSEVQQQHIYDPAGMTSTFSLPNPERVAVASIAHSYRPLPNGDFARIGLTSDGTYNMYGAGDVVSTAEDLRRFARALFAGELLDPALLMQALTPGRVNNGLETHIHFEPESNYGLGWIIGTRNGHRYVGHAGVWLGYRNYFAHFPDGDVTIAVLTARDYDYLAFRREVVLPIFDVYFPHDMGSSKPGSSSRAFVVVDHSK